MKVPFSRVYSFASDGASVVSSETRGVAGLLTKFVNAYVLSIHCQCHGIAHRQALVMNFKHAVKESLSAWAEWWSGACICRASFGAERLCSSLSIPMAGVRVCSRVDASAFAKDNRRVAVSSTMTASSVINPAAASAARMELDSARSGV